MQEEQQPEDNDWNWMHFDFYVGRSIGMECGLSVSVLLQVVFFETAKTFGFAAAMISYYFLSYLKTSVEDSCLVIVFLAMLVCMLALSIRTCSYTKDLKTISSMMLLRRKYYHTFLFFLSYSAHLLHTIKVVLSILKPFSVLSYKPFLPRIECRTRTLKLPIVFHKGWCQTASRSSRSLAHIDSLNWPLQTW